MASPEALADVGATATAATATVASPALHGAAAATELLRTHPAAWATLVATTLVLAAVPLAWWWWRQRRADWPRRLAALTTLTAVLTFDLIVFGAFTRLTDSGLGCPDWPGCYGHASPLQATGPIAAAQAAMPDGPVTWAKAWIEMIHRYLAMVVGCLIITTLVLAWRQRRTLSIPLHWPALTLVWVCAQGAFGAWTVTLKLYPAIVTVHLLGGIGLLALLVWQRGLQQPQPLATADDPGLPRLAAAGLALTLLQIALGGWVSTNYAVLACQGFPQCSGQWWPDGDWARGYTLLRPLGQDGQGAALPFTALVAIHWTHRLAVLPVVAVLGWLGWRLWRRPDGRRPALALAALVAAQGLSGLSNVVLGWPLLAALAHSGGAAALVALQVHLLARLRAARVPQARPWSAAGRPSASASLSSLDLNRATPR
jgi:heme a synthase